MHERIDLKSPQTHTTQGYVKKQTVQDLKAELSFDLLDAKNRNYEIQVPSIANQVDVTKNRRLKRNADSELTKKVLVEVLE